jgi:DNA-binding transcriptional MerR regulator
VRWQQIITLRSFGLPLHEIAQLLDGTGAGSGRRSWPP